jgi:hypothetical protein
VLTGFAVDGHLCSRPPGYLVSFESFVNSVVPLVSSLVLYMQWFKKKWMKIGRLAFLASFGRI